MRTEVYVKADIENILKALGASVVSLPTNDSLEDMYRLGFATALQSVALAFGIELATEAKTMPVTSTAYSRTEPG